MPKTVRSFIPLLLIALFSVLLPAVVRAQDDPPGRVGRLNYLQGSVSYQVAGQDNWVQADPNRPLTTGDNLWVDKDSRGEVHIDSTAIRMADQTGLSFLNLDDRTVQLELPQGRIEIHVRQLQPGDAFEIDTPNLAFSLRRAGEYVISTDPNGHSTAIVVREGEGDVIGGGDSWTLRAGQQYEFEGTDVLSYDALAAPDFDDFEAWCETRDQRENSSVSARYVSRDVDGYYDLDEYGDWSNDSDYGAVWYPRSVAVDWVPYHMGHWVYIAPWGWTWVDSEPWGFAPFHYGRWILVGARWGWVPGPVVVRPVYAPALVGFVGGGGFGFSVSIGSGFTGVAWFPLGPRDVFVPGYHCSPRYVQVVNVTNTRVVNVTQVTNVYNTVVVRRDVTHVSYTYGGNVRAVTAVSRETFTNARPVDREAVRIRDNDMRDVRVVSHTTFAPTSSSYLAANARVSNVRPAVPFSQRPVVANLPPRVPVQTRNHPPNNNGPRNFQSQGNENRGNSNAPDNGSRSFNRPMQPQQNPDMRPPVQGGPGPGNAQPSGNNGPRPFNRPAQPQQAPAMQPSAPSRGSGGPRGNQPSNGNAPAPSTPPNGRNPSPIFTQPMRGNSSAPAPGNNAPPQTQNNQPNQDRYRFNPPVKARDDNYDVHPPLNQAHGQSAPPQQPHEQAPPQQHDNGNRNNDGGGNKNNRDNKDKNH